MKIKQTLKGFAGLICIITTAMFLSSCVLAIPAVVKYYKDKSDFIASAEVRVPVEKVYSTAVKEAEARSPEIKIVGRNDAEHTLEITDGVETATFKTASLGEGISQILILAKSPKGVEREKELALRIIEVLCESMGVEYTITGKGILLPEEEGSKEQGNS